MNNIVSKVIELLTSKERKGALFLLLLMVVAMLLETMSISMVVPLIGLMLQDDFLIQYPSIKPMHAFLGAPSKTEIILGGISFLVLLYFIKNIFLGYSIWKQNNFAYRLQHRVSADLFKSYLNQSYQFHLKRNSAELIRNITTEVYYFTYAINALLLIFAELFVAFGVVGILFYIEPIGAITIITTLSVASLIFVKITKSKVLKWGQQRQVHDAMRLQHLQQGLGGVKEVKLYGKEADFLHQFGQHDFLSAIISSKQVVMQQLPRLWLEFLAISGLAMLIYVLLLKQLSMVEIMPILGLFAAAAFRLMPSANRLLGALQSLRFHSPVVHMLSNELKPTDKLESNPERSLNSVVFTKNITVQKVSYTYEGSTKISLDNVSISINKGESVGVVGVSGAGKSTLIDMLLGFLLPNSGEVLVDGNDIFSQLKHWRSQIGYVPQSIYLTDASLKCNIAFGLPEHLINIKAVERAVEAAQLTEFVTGLEQGLDTVVGEKGVRLSGGQRQRIGIARALYNNPEVLVLDEATSALDEGTEAYVMQAIDALHGVKTVIIIAHRLSTVSNCDRLYQLQHGKVIAEGPPTDILCSINSVNN